MRIIAFLFVTPENPNQGSPKYRRRAHRKHRNPIIIITFVIAHEVHIMRRQCRHCCKWSCCMNCVPVCVCECTLVHSTAIIAPAKAYTQCNACVAQCCSPFAWHSTRGLNVVGWHSSGPSYRPHTSAAHISNGSRQSPSNQQQQQQRRSCLACGMHRICGGCGCRLLRFFHASTVYVCVCVCLRSIFHITNCIFSHNDPVR